MLRSISLCMSSWAILMFKPSPKGVFFLYSSLYFVYFSMNQNLEIPVGRLVRHS